MAQVDTDFPASSAELRKVERVRFGILSPEEIKAMSVCEVETPFTYDNATPKDGGLLDLRMGTMERDHRCKTCNGDMTSCPGHFGHIELVQPCLHIGLMPIIAKILKCVCFHCSSLLLAPDNPKWAQVMRIKKPAKRLHAMLKICQTMKKCNGGFGIDPAASVEDAERERLMGDGMMDDGPDGVRKPRPVSSGCGNVLPKYKASFPFCFPAAANRAQGCCSVDYRSFLPRLSASLLLVCSLPGASRFRSVDRVSHRDRHDVGRFLRPEEALERHADTRDFQAHQRRRCEVARIRPAVRTTGLVRADGLGSAPSSRPSVGHVQLLRTLF
jgi:hypothetical protein